MASLLQYRRLREEVQEDLARIEQLQPGLRTPESSEREPEKLTPIPGVTISRPDEGNGKVVFVVGWKENDPNNPKNWALSKKWMATLTCCSLAIPLSVLTSIEGATQSAFNEHFEVDELAGSMITGKTLIAIWQYRRPITIAGIFLIGVAVGSLFAGPFSETFGRNTVYVSTGIVVELFVMAKALAPNFGAALAFRFLCALFAASPMTVSGGTVGDIWTQIQLPFGLPFVFFASYAGPVLGPVIGAYTPEIGFIWADWISMIFIGVALVFVLLAQPETYSPVLLEWRARHFRNLTGDDRYQVEHAVANSFSSRLRTNLSRPFTMIWTEPIILVFSFYLVLLYFVLFTFLNGYPYIFTMTYGISESLTFIIWSAMLPGIFVAMALIPYMYHLTNRAAAKAEAKGSSLQPEVSLYWAMAGASILMPISLFWMAWTCYVSLSLPPLCSYANYLPLRRAT